MFVNVGLDHLILEWLKTHNGRIIGSAVCCVATTAGTTFVVPVGIEQVRLARDGVTTTAEVLETVTYSGDRDSRDATSAAVRYRFVVNGVPYHFTGAGGSDLAYVPGPVLERAATTRRIDVIYRPADPANNAPAAKRRGLWGWGSGFVVVPPVLTVLAWAWVARVARDEKARRNGATIGHGRL